MILLRAWYKYNNRVVCFSNLKKVPELGRYIDCSISKRGKEYQITFLEYLTHIRAMILLIREHTESIERLQILFLQGSVLFGPRMDEVTGEWRRLHNEELNDLYCSPNIVRVIKSRRMRWAGHVARMGEERGVYKVLVGETGGKETTGEN